MTIWRPTLALPGRCLLVTARGRQGPLKGIVGDANKQTNKQTNKQKTALEYKTLQARSRSMPRIELAPVGGCWFKRATRKNLKHSQCFQVSHYGR